MRKVDTFQRYKVAFPIGMLITQKSWLFFTLLLVIGGAIIPFSQSLGMGIILLGMSIVALGLERNLTASLLMAPLVAFCFRDTFGKGLSVLLVYGAGSQDYNTYSMFQSLLSLTLFFACFFIAYKILRKKENFTGFPMSSRAFQQEILKPLAWFGMACFLYAVFGVLVLALSGNIDRGFVSETKYYGAFGFDSLFRVFHRFTYVGFLLLPVVWRYGPVLFRFLILPGFAFFALIAFASGGRGMLFYPFIFIGLGYYIFSVERPLRFERIGILVFPFFLCLMYVIDVYRGTSEFYNTELSSITERLDAISAIDDRIKEQGSTVSTAVTKVGKRLYGDLDPIIYQMTPHAIRHAGFENFNSLLWVWIPRVIYPNQPFAADAVFIVQNYRNVFNTTHIGITLPSDLYRRFGWFGVPVGGFIFGAFFALIINAMFTIYYKNNALLGVILFALMITLFQDRIFSTVTGTIYSFMYHFLKHVFVVWVGLFLYGAFFKRIRGASAYGP